VFVNHEGDLYRTRLTHSLEVAQIGRTVARALNVNEDLVEAVSLAHDLGHTPFGHAGQDALNECMRDHGGFEHNLQSLRVVDSLEQGYASFPGLNLTFETREGILKHCSARNAHGLGELGRRFIERLEPSLEAQITDIADAVAYNNHDVDDGLRAGLIELADLKALPFFAEQLQWTRRAFPSVPEHKLHHEVIRRMIDVSVGDLVATSSRNIAAAAPRDIDDVRKAGRPLIGFSAAYRDAHRELKAFLRDHLYTHPHVRKMTSDAHATVTRLFAAFNGNHGLMPDDHARHAEEALAAEGAAGAARVVADYIAGMTDRFALQTLRALEAGNGRT
jgi:dGTPase